jgi:hypothetical protein
VEVSKTDSVVSDFWEPTILSTSQTEKQVTSPMMTEIKEARVEGLISAAGWVFSFTCLYNEDRHRGSWL